jgi:hypothetical protein
MPINPAKHAHAQSKLCAAIVRRFAAEHCSHRA